MKKIIVLLLIILSFFSVLITAQSMPTNGVSQEEYDRDMLILAAKGLPLPNSGVQIVPASEIGFSTDDLNNMLSQNKQLINNGFCEVDNPRAREILNFKHTIPLQKKKYANASEPWKTYIRDDVSQLKMAYNFIGVPELEMSSYHGIAPAGVYRDNGWSGATQLFDKVNFGSLAYTEDNFQISHGAVKIAQELVRFDINNKPSLIYVLGNKKSGFLYTVEWFDDTHAHKLECSNMHYSSETTAKVIELAKRIDVVNH